MAILSSNLQIDFYPVSGLHGDEDKLFSFVSPLAGPSPQPPKDLHTINAYVDVRPGIEGAPVCKTIKQAFFSTNRSTQILNLTMNIDPVLVGKVHFLMATHQDGHAAKCKRVEHGDVPVGIPKWARDFGKHCPIGARKVSLVFAIPRHTIPFNFDIHILDNRNPQNPIDIPCDPQAGNDPPDQGAPEETDLASSSGKSIA